MFERIDPDDSESTKRFRDMMAPQIDHFIRQAVSHCWMILPKERETMDEVEKEIRRVVDRALRDFREDATSFGWFLRAFLLKLGSLPVAFLRWPAKAARS